MMNKTPVNPKLEGILLLDKSAGPTSFSLVRTLRKLTNIQKIGHAGTLDPFATGLMIYLIGKNYTKKSDIFLNLDKEYIATLKLGASTNTFDLDGQIQNRSDTIPTLSQIEEALNSFQGKIKQVPPMFSAKKVRGKKLYDLARKGIEIQREPIEITVQTALLSYEYPFVRLKVTCSKGTYIRTIGHDLGVMLNSYAYLTELQRTRIGPYHLSDSISQKDLEEGKNYQDSLTKKIPVS